MIVNKSITMKKIILSLAVILVTVFHTNAQSFTLSWNGVTLSDTVTLGPETAGGEEIMLEVILTNNTGSDAGIKVARNEVQIEPGSENYFCWGACYPPFIDTSGMTMTIPAGGSSLEGDFSGHYVPNGTTGLSTISYSFYDNDSGLEVAKIVFIADPNVVAIDENSLSSIQVSDIYPNPATNYINLDYSLPKEIESANIAIYNVLGSVVMKQQVELMNNKFRMDISELDGGVYFYSLLLNGESYITKKLVIR